MGWFARRHCRRWGHVWRHRHVALDMCNATHSACERCGFVTWRHWEYDR